MLTQSVFFSRLRRLAGKQARVNQVDEPQTKQQAVPTQAQKIHAEPVMIDPKAAPTTADAEAGLAHTKQHAAYVPPATAKPKNIDSAEIAKLVAEENEARSKFPKYPGLERWALLEKMGDGAFSNVYRARDTLGQYGEVGVKVVRKYEMNNMQVSLQPGSRCFTAGQFSLHILRARPFFFLGIILIFYLIFPFGVPLPFRCASSDIPTTASIIGRQTSTSRL